MVVVATPGMPECVQRIVVHVVLFVTIVVRVTDESLVLLLNSPTQRYIRMCSVYTYLRGGWTRSRAMAIITAFHNTVKGVMYGESGFV